MKIAILSFYSGINQRGVERWVYEFATRLSRENETTVFQNKALEVLPDYKTAIIGIKYIHKKRPFSWIARHLFIDYDSLRIFLFSLKILKVLFKEKYDVVIPTDGGWEPAIVRIITWLQKKKMVIVGHAGIGCDDANNIWSFPDVFVALSSYARDWAKKVNPLIRIEYIPNGVNLEIFNTKREVLELNMGKPIALCVSALEEGKRIELIIKAVAKIQSLNLLVCGGGELKEYINNLGRKFLKDRFKMKQFSFEKMPQVYRSCDLLLSASLPHYSFEMVLLEAMASGLPVVANNDPIRREIVGEAGILINPVETDKFSKAIKKVMKTDWGSTPTTQAVKFSWDFVFNKYMALLNSLIIRR